MEVLYLRPYPLLLLTNKYLLSYIGGSATFSFAVSRSLNFSALIQLIALIILTYIIVASEHSRYRIFFVWIAAILLNIILIFKFSWSVLLLLKYWWAWEVVKKRIMNRMGKICSRPLLTEARSLSRIETKRKSRSSRQ